LARSDEAKAATPEQGEGGPVALYGPHGAKDYGLAGQPLMNAFFYVYILVSEADSTIHYTGVTQDLADRLREHNRGACAHTAKYRPWRVETAVSSSSEAKARLFERYLKSGSGREFARRHF
jgi:predicted GIY-YIG superfamily endonuclease